MAVFRCKMCGGDLEIEQGSTVTVCQYCGSKQTVPSADNEKKMTLFGRANRLLRACEFDKASGIFESIVADFPEEAEAYWGLVLCKYGIEYVDDPATGEKVPTCHRSSFDSVMDDSDFDQTLENADAVAKRVYREEAKQIEELRKSIIEVSGKEDPYDIFISYKETDDTGERTIDSVLAQDIYDELKSAGYRVFFSRISLEDKLGTEYEPYIFAALNSAKLMIVVGTDYEYFNAVWVKNEWGRYLKIMSQDKSRHLIPCYKSIDAYDMPKEFAKLAAQDLGKVGAMQDLLRGIKKIVPIDDKKEIVINTVNSADNSIEPLLKRAFMFLEDGNWSSADEYCEKVLDKDPENSQAYLGKLMAELHVSEESKLAKQDKLFDTYDNYKKAIRFANNSRKTQIEKYVDEIIEKKKEKEKVASDLKAKQEAEAETVYKQLIEISEYEELSSIKEDLSKYKDSAMDKSALSAKKEMLRSKIASHRKEVTSLNMFQLKRMRELIVLGKEEEKTLFELEYIERLIIRMEELNTELSVTKNEDKTKAELPEIISKINSVPNIKSYIESKNIGLRITDKIKNQTGIKSTFGRYKQKIGQDKTPIEWLVLAREGKKVLVISKYGLDSQPYNNYEADVTWERCSIRKWLNSDFLNTAFSTEEQSMISITNVSADINPYYNTNPGNDTNDKVFLLSLNEVEKYFPSEEDRQCKPTEFACYSGAHTYKEDGNCWWPLRTPGNNQKNVLHIANQGNYLANGFMVNFLKYSVRPAMWINLED